MTNSHKPEMLIKQLISWIQDDPSRAGLVNTPDRVVASWNELYRGYNCNEEYVKSLITDAIFDDEPCDELVLLKDIEFYSTCEHHMLPFIGKAHVAYIPAGNLVIGISKLARVLEIYSRRLQIQERIGRQVTHALMEYLVPKGAACILEAKHLCIACRGVGKQHSTMVTSSLTGVFKDDMNARQELLRLIGK